MAYAGQVPWHGLGTRVDDDLSVDEMLIAAGLDWTVRKVPTFYELEKEQMPWERAEPDVIYTGQSVLLRDTDDSLLTIVTDDWEPCQNHEAFEIFAEFVDRNELEMHTAGSLKDGQLVWALTKMKQEFVLFNDDVTEQYLLLVNPHQYGRAIHIRNTPIRVVCNNTLSMAMGRHSDMKASQTHRTRFDPDAMKEAMGIATAQMENYAATARFLGSREFGDATVQDYFDRVFPSMSTKKGKEHSRNAINAMNLLQSESQPGAEYGRYTWWQAFNTVTYMSDHVLGKHQDKRLHSAWFGANAVRKNNALELAVEFAEAA
jgi:phage/plasmid-like protein (TIGR03299 family)